MRAVPAGLAADETTRAWLQARLAQQPGAGDASPPSGPLASAALGVIEAAERYRRAAEIEPDEP